MMVEFGWIKMSFFLILVRQIAAAGNGRHHLSVIVGDENDVTLPCENVIQKKHNCGKTTWVFQVSRNMTKVELTKRGQISEKAKAKSDRLSVTENCSLVIKKVTAKDVGKYTCQQYKLGHEYANSPRVHLSVVTMTEHKDDDEVMLKCSVSTYEQCRHTVKWLYEGKDVDEDNKDMKTSQSYCSASLTFKTSHFIHTPKVLKCEVTDGGTGKGYMFTFSRQSEGTKTGKDSKEATTKSTTIGTMGKNTTIGTNKTDSANDTAKKLQGWWMYVLAAVGLAALLIIVYAAQRWRRAKAKNTQRDENITDHEDDVSYATISFSKKTNSTGRVRGSDDDDEGDAVIYSTVKVSSSSAGASADPSDLYATFNKPNK